VARGGLVPGALLPITAMDGGLGLGPGFSHHGLLRQYDIVSC
jgi:hypothetical protein